ncbi:MAG: heparin lyase I family protein [Crocinitomicaceae bacterium]|nr:heparin lyase I family protein [Crocinitomicaceae bacterium]
MKKRKNISHLIPLLILFWIFNSCNKEKYFGGPDSYTDDFESYLTIDSLLDGNNVRWSFFQQTLSSNHAEIDTQIVHSGNQSIRFNGILSSETVSKSSIVKQKMAFYEGETVEIEMWFYIQGTDDLEWLFLFDLEENSAIGAGPGMRLAMVSNQLRVEHKYNNPDIVQKPGNEINVPRNEWFKIKFETLLSQKEKGSVKVWQNDTLIIEQYNWVTLPSDFLYFQQGTKGMYTNIEFGITANSTEHDVILYLDDVTVKVKP